MHEDVKRYADSNDIKGLRYIFVDCLDVDPTFEEYAEDFEYCKNKAGLFEPHRELAPMTENQRLWNDRYWVQLKTDLLKNFSRERFGHMRQVAQVVYADKIVRVTAERKRREEQERRNEEKRRQLALENQRVLEEERKEKSAQMQESTAGGMENAGRSQREEQDRWLEERRRQLEQNNQRAREEERKQKERLEKMRSNRVETTASSMENFDSKKVVGVVLVVVIIVIIILIVMAM